MRRIVSLTVVLLVFGIAFSPVSAADPQTEQIDLNNVELDQDNLRVHFIDVGNGLKKRFCVIKSVPRLVPLHKQLVQQRLIHFDFTKNGRER